MTRLLIASILIAGNLAASDHLLKITPETVAWGYYWSAAKPVLTVKSGDTVTVECVSVGNPKTLEAAGLPADQVEADIRALYANPPKDKGPGGHPLTGPIAIEGAMPGDVLEVRIKEIRLRAAYAFNSFGPTSGFLKERISRPARRGSFRWIERRWWGTLLRVSTYPFGLSSAAWASRRRKPPEKSAARLPEFTPATWIIRNWWRAPPSSFRCMRPARYSKSATATRAWATAKWTSPPWRLRSPEFSSLYSTRTCT